MDAAAAARTVGGARARKCVNAVRTYGRFRLFNGDAATGQEPYHRIRAGARKRVDTSVQEMYVAARSDRERGSPARSSTGAAAEDTDEFASHRNIARRHQAPLGTAALELA